MPQLATPAAPTAPALQSETGLAEIPIGQRIVHHRRAPAAALTLVLYHVGADTKPLPPPGRSESHRGVMIEFPPPAHGGRRLVYFDERP